MSNKIFMPTTLDACLYGECDFCAHKSPEVRLDDCKLFRKLKAQSKYSDL